MPTSAPRLHRPAFRLKAWLPSGRSLLWTVLAFAVGVALFLWAISGRKDDFYRVDQTGPTAARREYAPLPTPLPGGESEAASGMGEAREGTDGSTDRPRLVDAPKPPPAPPAAAATTTPRPSTTGAATTLPMPVAGKTPAPSYPSRALRRGESGTVRVRVVVGPDGRPTEVSVEQASGSRDLDRAAVNAVKRWRFHPARRDGEPITGTVIVPISFTPH